MREAKIKNRLNNYIETAFIRIKIIECEVLYFLTSLFTIEVFCAFIFNK